jgi:hypothetical protein
MSIMDIDAIDRAALLEQSKDVIEAEKQCRITLHPDAPREYHFNWHPGKGGRNTVLVIKPGQSIVQPLSKAQAHFGPFSIPREYAKTTDERRKNALRDTWVSEKTRALCRFDYERPLSVKRDGYEPIGPHRFPHVIVTVLEADGTEHAPMDLHELYKIGEHDPLKDSFGPKESVAEVKAKYEAQLDEAASAHAKEIYDLKSSFNALGSKLDGFMAGSGAVAPPKPKPSAGAPA